MKLPSTFTTRVVFFSTILLFLSLKGFGQVNGLNYTYSTASYGIWTANAGTVLVAGGSVDDAVYTIAPTGAGWTGFYYGSKYYPPGTTIHISTNGWISFVAQASSLPTNSLATTPNIIAPLWDDMRLGATAISDINWKLSSQRLIIEWDSVYWDKSAATWTKSIQLTLYSRTHATPNMIEFKYKNNGTVGTGSGGASVGFSGFCAGDYYSYAFQPGGGAPIKTAENSGIVAHPSISFVYRHTPTVHPNDDCTASFNIGTFNAASAVNSYDGTTLHSSQTAGAPSCGGATTWSDVWFTFTKPANLTNFEIFTDDPDCRGASYRAGLEVFNSCPVGAPLACDFGSTGPAGTNASSYLNFTNQACAATQYWVRVFCTDTLYKGYFRFNIRPPGKNCTYANNITGCGLPYTAPTGLSTCNFGFDYDSTASDCHNSFNKGEDYVFSYTPPATVCVDFHLNNTPAISFPGLFIYNGCPNAGNCLGSVTSAGGSNMDFNNVTLAAGNTYYFVVEYDSTNLVPCLTSFDFSITLNATSPPIYDNCANAPNVPVNTSTFSTCVGALPYYNSCATPSTTGTVPAPLCGFFVDGVTPDVWFRFTSSGTVQPHTINVNPQPSGTAQDLCMQIYSGTCGALTPIVGACDDNSSGFNLPSITFVPPATGTQYYIRIWSNNGTEPGNFNICAIVGCTPANDLPCNATTLTLGTPTNGDNACSSGAGEPGIATCWDAVTVNTVWYKFTPTFTGNVNIRTRLFSLFDSQIGVYTGTCGPSLVQSGGTSCNNDITEGCAGSLRTYRHSVINNFPVVSGTTYYVRLDGRGSNTGSFEILVLNSLDPLPPVPVQDCVVAQTVCGNASFTIADPGYQGIGHYCDLATAPGCFIGERSSAWYLVSIQNPAPANSYFQFSINPFAGTDYDFFVWRVDGIPNWCSTLNNYGLYPWYRGSWTDTYAPTGVSLAAGSGTTSICIGAVGPAFHPAYPVTGGEIFLILVSNWWGNTSGFTMDWLGTPIAGTPPVRYWQNATDSVWTTTTNWTPLCGGVPDCAVNGISAVITNIGPSPYITGTRNVKDITINVGATLRLAPGATLDVCGNFVNNGTLQCGAGSTIRFYGTAALQTISGTFSATNSFPNFVVTKGVGTLRLLTDIYISGVDSIIGGVFDNNLRSTWLGGNFYNYNGATSFINVGTGTFTFNGAANQNFTNLVSNITFNNVTVFQAPASTVTLGSGAFNNMILGTSGILNLTAGQIVTGALMVDVTNPAAGAVTPGNILSFVRGNLRRAIPAGLGTFEFPVGEVAKGYQRFSLSYTAAPSTSHTLTGKFSQWSGMPAAGPNVTECITANWSCCAPYDNGYWTMNASIGSGFGTYTANAYPLAVTNDIGGAPNGYSIMKSVSNSGGGPWVIEGVCVTPSATVSPVSRTGLNTFSDFGVVQYTSPLPIVLLSFNAEQVLEGNVLCTWVTSTEINNDRFEIQRKIGSGEFVTIGSVRGYGPGATSDNHYYSFPDKDLCNSVNYYRLKQVDIDGRFTYSEIVAVKCKARDDMVSLFPNPATSELNISFLESSDGQIHIDILDMFGNIVSSAPFAVKKDMNSVTLKINDLSNGFYYLRLKNTGDTNETDRQVRFLKY